MREEFHKLDDAIMYSVTENESEENITVANWVDLLNDTSIFTDEAKDMLRYIYCCSNHKASFTDIAESFDVSYQKISLLNVKIAKNILNVLNKKPPINDNGESFYYNIIFTGVNKNERGHLIAVIRPNLIKAIEELKYFEDSFVAINSNTNELESIFYNDGEAERKKVQYLTTKYERSQKNRNAAIRIHGLSCYVCTFNFKNTYGDIGKDFIEVHHCVPLYNKDEIVSINPKTDLVCVCSNCHRMLHRKRDRILNPEELKSIMKNNLKTP